MIYFYMIYFTADTHFSHANIIKYCNRPFKDVQEMNETLIDNWNSVVQDSDTVYVLGDFGFGDCSKIIQKLKGIKILIIGSHDKDTIRLCKSYFKFITPLYELKQDNYHITLCHYCMRIWPKSHYNSWHLYGHSHGSLEPIGKSWDVGVDKNSFIPLSLNNIIEIMKNQKDNFNLVKR
jgi:calcineurin-like phosphoesterase family protein